MIIKKKKTIKQSNLQNHTEVMQVNSKKETCMVLNNFPSIPQTNS